MFAAIGSFISPGITPKGKTIRPHEYSSKTIAPVYQAKQAPKTKSQAPTLI
jgi:hypothetical protein